MIAPGKLISMKEGYIMKSKNSKQKSKKLNKDTFLNKYSSINLEDDYKKVEERIPNFWEIIEEIWEHYQDSAGTYKSTLKEIIDKISEKDLENPVIHSVRYRIKDAESLIVKIIQKSACVPKEPQNNPEIEKYRNISKNNYYKIITDLIGVRILIRYRYQWEEVHNLIWSLYHSSEYGYIQDWLSEYKNDPAMSSIVEQPRAYVKQEEDRVIYEKIGKNTFNIRNSDNHYASVHYIINQSGRYCEIQVRTIFDEAWCECNHDCVYKPNINNNKTMQTLEQLSIILSQHTTAAESIVDLMCDLSKRTPPDRGKKVKKGGSSKDDEISSKQNTVKRFQDMVQYAEQISNFELPDILII